MAKRGDSRARRAPRRPELARMGVVALATVLCHLWNLRGDYVYDDFIYIAMNPTVQAGLSEWTRFFTDPTSYSWLPTRHYRPLVSLSYAVNVAMGWGIFGFKVTQLALHVATALLLYKAVALMVRELKGVPDGVPFLAALLFGIMPFNVEAVHYLTARSAVLCGLFSMVALVLFLKLRRAEGGRAWALYVAHLAALGVALLSKETALTVPGLLFAVDLLVVGGGLAARRWRTVAFWWPYAPYAVGLALALAIMPNVTRVGSYFAQVFHTEWRLSAAIFCLWENVRLMVLPTGLTLAHPISRSAQLTDPLTLASGLLAAALLAWGLWNARRRPLVAVGVIWYFLLIAPSTFVHLNTVLMENRGYTASMGIALVMGWLAAAAWRALAGRHRTALGVAAGVVLAAFALIGWQRQQVWASNLTVWEDAVAHDPSSNDAVLNLGVRYVMANRLDDAERMFKTLVARSPDWHAGGLNLAHVYLLRKQFNAAREVLEPMVEKRPFDPGPLEKLARAYAGLGRLADAIAMYRRAVDAEIANMDSRVFVHELVPGEYPEALMDLALRAGRPADAEWALERFRQRFPDHPRGDLMAMKLYAATGRWADAEAALDVLAERLPDDPRVPQWRAQIAAMRAAAAGRP